MARLVHFLVLGVALLLGVAIGTGYRVSQGVQPNAPTGSEPGVQVRLCGVDIPHDAQLAGHSDADVALHAVTDAILGAIGDGDIKLSSDIEARLRDKCQPLQPSVPAGSVLIRDIRLWHRGMPNRTGQPRPMIAMIHWARWWHTGKPLLFPKGTEELFANSALETVAEFVEGLIDYISRNRQYDYPG